ncbi:MAG: magnesium transporter [Beggiatoa sp. IS2]|nr:MAG: magnesium transporter [Beggiatoa sp. IS2]
MHDEIKHQKNLQDTLTQVISLLKKQELVSMLVSKQDSPRQNLVQILVEKQHLTELHQKLQQLHPADVAYVLENLPPKERQLVWDLLKIENHGAILLELSDNVRKTLIADMEDSEIMEVAEHLDTDEIADLVPDLPKDTVFKLLTALDSQDRAQVQSVLTFPEDTVGALMEFDMVTVREDVMLDVVLRHLRQRGELPARTNQLFVVERSGKLTGLLLLRDLLTNDPETLVSTVMIKNPIFFYTNEATREVAQAFERYDLISAPVINSHQQLVGCINIDAIIDFMNATSHKEMLNQVGLSEEENIFAPLWQSAKNRWMWLALNLMTAFIASRVIGIFAGTIEKLVALATLMPIVASIGGNTGNQTIALMIRGLTLNQINARNFRHLLAKEITISIVNGTVWGSVVGLFAYVLYQHYELSLVLIAAMLINLLIASLAGVFVPVILYKLKYDPVMGSSVILTALTDSMGFFIFLGLATIFLL